MNHTYDSLRELACLAVTTVSLEAPGAVLVLEDALRDAGVLLGYSPECMTPAEHQRQFTHGWVMRWAMKAAYGAPRICTITLEIDGKWAVDKSDHRAWTNERIECRRRGEIWKQKRKKAA
jgi:hypothetical protein